MSNINKIQAGETTYDITPSSTGTFDGTSEDSTSPTSWTDVAVLATGETNGSIFTKISNMFKNIRYLYSKLGTTDISGVGNTITAAISALSSGKSNSDHTHPIATSSAAGFLPALDGSSDKCLLGDGTWGTAGSTYATVSTAAPGLAPTLSGTATQYLNGNGSWTTPPDNNTTYANFTSAAAGLTPAAGNGSTNYATSAYVLTGAGWAAGTKYNTDTNTTYANFTSAAAGLAPAAKNGTTNYATTAYVLTGAGWAAGTKYNTDTTYNVMGAATASAAGTNGLVPAPAAGKQGAYLRGDKTWSVPANTTYATFTSAANGLVPAAKSGSTNYATTAYVLTGAGWAAGTKYNTDTNTTYALNTSGVKAVYSNGTLTLNPLSVRV